MLKVGLQSIRYKLLLLVLVSSFATLVVAGAALMYNDVREFRQMLGNELTAQADIIGQASSAALEFNDAKVAAENLALLKAKPEILAAALYTAKGSLFAQYQQQAARVELPKLPELDSVHIEGQRLVLFKRVISHGEILGTIYLSARYDLLARLIDYLAILGGAMLLSLLVGGLISSRLQSHFTEPILAMSKVALQVREQRDFRLRAAKTSNDEVGYLVDAFNDMLAEIGDRNAALVASRQALEHEIIERSVAQKALAASEQRIHALVSTMSSVIWICDRRGCFMVDQDSWAQYTGQPMQEYLGLGWRTRFHPDDQGQLDRAWSIALMQSSAFALEARLWHAESARYRFVSLRAVPVINGDGNTAADTNSQDNQEAQEWIGSITDIDDRRKAEFEVLTLNMELERRVSERTAQLEIANKDLESFSYSVSHDLRAPVRAVAGFSAILRNTQGDELGAESRRLLDIISSEANRMGMLIDDLLSFSRLGRQAMQMRNMDMGQLVQKTFEQLNLEQSGPPLQFRLGQLPQAEGDRTLLGQVWANLLSNALKFTAKREEAMIEVGAISDDEKFTFFVRDNGAGFDPRYKDKLFGVFQRLHGTSEFAGNGVGLALVQRIIHRHGGRVWAEGKPDAGATFYFTLPRHTGTA